MNQLITQLKRQKYLFIDQDQLNKFLSGAEIIRRQDTLISGYLRLAKYDDNYIIQETTDKNEIVLRLFENRADAEKLINDRLDIYEKMWNGCGCKVNYYD